MNLRVICIRVGDETQFEIEDSNEVLGLATSHCPFEV